jgi:hypothetical protein
MGSDSPIAGLPAAALRKNAGTEAPPNLAAGPERLREHVDDHGDGLVPCCQPIVVMYET